MRVPNTHLGPALVGRGRGHICVGLIWLVAGSRSGLVGGADGGGERSMHYFQQKPSPLSAFSLHPTTHSLQLRLDGPGAGGWARGQGPLSKHRRDKLRGWAWLPEEQGAGFPGMKTGVGE